jgi:cytochrome c oxidase cbb3-type subunit III
MSLPNRAPNDPVLRPHSYDGIQEYDQRLPNWWLFTLYGAIIFAAAYWAYYEWTGHMEPGWVRVNNQIEALSLAALEQGAAPNSTKLWDLSQDPTSVASGEKTFLSNCAACHGIDLKGGIGQDLTDPEWIHGGTPIAIFELITVGVATKGMPTWGPILGQKRIAEVTAFIIAKNSTIEKPAEEEPTAPESSAGP